MKHEKRIIELVELFLNKWHELSYVNIASIPKKENCEHSTEVEVSFHFEQDNIHYFGCKEGSGSYLNFDKFSLYYSAVFTLDYFVSRQVESDEDFDCDFWLENGEVKFVYN